MLSFFYGVHWELLYVIPTNWLVTYVLNALKLKCLKTLFHEKFIVCLWLGASGKKRSLISGRCYMEEGAGNQLVIFSVTKIFIERMYRQLGKETNP